MERASCAPISGILRKDYFGNYDVNTPGHMGYHWRQTFWYEPEDAIYRTHGNSGYLFRYQPEENRVEVIERLTSTPSCRSGMFDMHYCDYPELALGNDGHTLFYFTGGPIPGRKREQTGVLGRPAPHTSTPSPLERTARCTLFPIFTGGRT
ncbi:MAG: hypothetical protein HUU41_02220 [Bryobacteraceae bacterium]|nr:hypothetical protein [Bryobacterales bacterium]MEB2363436.1 hypothetical protein [Bryobacterales bacterium]NUM99904.1 hypothetical protein [Bryobacteraceae bacterium]